MYRLVIALLFMVCGPHATTSIDLSEMKPELTCSSQVMTACFPYNPNFLISAEKVKNGACYQYASNATNVCVSVKIKQNQCGVSPSQNATHVTYASNLFINQDFGTGIITRNDTLNVSISCSYPLDALTSLNIMLLPNVTNYVINITKDGKFNVSMSLYQYSNYTGAYQKPASGGLTFSTKTMLYLGLVTDVGDNDTFVLLMNNCFATPTNNYYDSLRYDIIKNRCPYTGDTTIGVDENGESIYGRFHVKMFKFIGDAYDSVFLHCNVTLCNKTAQVCKPSCGAKSDSVSAVDGPVQTLSIGPLRASGVRASLSAMVPVLLLMVCSLFLL